MNFRFSCLFLLLNYTITPLLVAQDKVQPSKAFKDSLSNLNYEASKQRAENPALVQQIEKIESLLYASKKADQEKFQRYILELKIILKNDSCLYWKGTGYLLLPENKNLLSVLLKNGLNRNKISLDKIKQSEELEGYLKQGSAAMSIKLLNFYEYNGENEALIKLLRYPDINKENTPFLLSQAVENKQYELAKILINAGTDISMALPITYLLNEAKFWLLILSSPMYQYDPEYTFKYYTSKSGQDGNWNTTRQEEHYEKMGSVIEKIERANFSLFQELLMKWVENNNTVLPIEIVEIYDDSRFSENYKLQMLKFILNDSTGLYKNKNSKIFVKLFFLAIQKHDFELATKLLHGKPWTYDGYKYIINNDTEVLAFLIDHQVIKDEASYFIEDKSSFLYDAKVTPLHVAVHYNREELVVKLMRSNHDAKRELVFEGGKKMTMLKLAKKSAVSKSLYELLKKAMINNK